MKADKDYGTVEIRLKEYLVSNGISKNFLESHADVGRTQLNNYTDGKAQRIDLAVMARFCSALKCDLNDLLVYIPPKEK